jgi:hypothetical protein
MNITQLLPHYTAKAKTMSDAALLFALDDVRATLAIWDRAEHADPAYVAKLYAEKDAYTVERYNRTQRRGRNV